MSRSTKKTIFALIILIMIVVFGAAVNRNFIKQTSHNQAAGMSSVEASKAASEQIQQDTINSEAVKNVDAKSSGDPKSLHHALSSDIVLGNKSAPVTVIEYASLSCPHCATFHSEAMPKLKSEYIEAGKVQFIHRDFPLNQPALVGSMIAICKAMDNKEDQASQYYDFLKALFRTQDAWAFAPNFAEKLESIAKLDGMSSDRFKSCVNDAKLQESILATRLEASKLLNIQSTPTFIINGQLLNGYTGWDDIKKVIDKKLASVGK